MQIDASGSTITSVQDSLQIYQSLPEIMKKLEADTAFRNYVRAVAGVFASEVNFALRSSLTRGRTDGPAANERRRGADRGGQPLHLQGELPTHIRPTQ